MDYINRHMEQLVLKLSTQYSAILITGPRQAGKTTMLRKLAEQENTNREYITLDDLAARDMAKHDPALFLQLYKPPILIDEVQYAPDGKLCPLAIKKTAMPDKRLAHVFSLIDKPPLQLRTGAILCMAEHFGAIDRNTLIVPIWMI